MADLEALLDTATQLFLRYGYKKTSMEEVARAVGISRQGLYLHFPNKEDLFRAGLRRLMDTVHATVRAALGDRESPLEDRLVAALSAYNGHALGHSMGAHLDELLEASRALMGNAVDAMEASVVDELARALKAGGIAANWKEAGLSVKQLAENLQLSAGGIKRRVQTADAFRDRIRVAVRLVVQGHASSQR